VVGVRGGQVYEKSSSVIQTKEEVQEKPKMLGRLPALSAGFGASCLCSGPSHPQLGGNQGDLADTILQKSKTQPSNKSVPLPGPHH
jgi:hypothetical protein